MTRKRTRIVDRLSGRGQVLKEANTIADVVYSLEILQEMVAFSTFAGSGELEGHRDIRGSITVLSGERNLTDGSVLTLRLQDGRTWAFFAKSGDPVSGTFLVVNASGEGLVSPPSTP